MDKLDPKLLEDLKKIRAAILLKLGDSPTTNLLEEELQELDKIIFSKEHAAG